MECLAPYSEITHYSITVIDAVGFRLDSDHQFRLFHSVMTNDITDACAAIIFAGARMRMGSDMLLFTLFPLSQSLCLETPFGSFADRIGANVVVEASQINFSLLKKLSGSCDSVGGPFCSFMHGDSSRFRALEVVQSDTFIDALGIPKEVTIQIGSPTLPSANSTVRSFNSFQLAYSGLRIPRFGQSEHPAAGLSRLGPASLTWTGSWYIHPVTFRPTYTSASTLRFSTPIVVQRLTVNGSTLMVGRLGGQEMWRREEKEGSLVGFQVFAKWRGNGALYRATVMADEGGLGAWVSWKDGDQSFRSISRTDIISVVRGSEENLQAVDEIEFIPIASSAHIQLTDLVVTVGGRDSVKVVRAGGGLVFDEQVSAGAIMYSASELIAQGLVVKDVSNQNNSRLIYALGRPAPSATALQNRRSDRNIILWSMLMGNSELIRIFVKNSNSQLISKFLNMNDMFNAIVDNGNVRSAASDTVRFAEQVAMGSPQKGVVAAGDAYHGDLVCAMNQRINLRIDVVRVQPIGARASRVNLRIQMQGLTVNLVGDFFTHLGMLYVPATHDWAYPLTLIVARVDTLLSVELIGTAHHIGCGGLVMRPVTLSQSTMAAAATLPVDTWAGEITKIINKFNTILSGLLSMQPTPSSGLGPLEMP